MKPLPREIIKNHTFLIVCIIEKCIEKVYWKVYYIICIIEKLRKYYLETIRFLWLNSNANLKTQILRKFPQKIVYWFLVS